MSPCSGLPPKCTGISSETGMVPKSMSGAGAMYCSRCGWEEECGGMGTCLH